MAASDCLCKERKCGRCRLIELARARAEAQAVVTRTPAPLIGSGPRDPARRT